MGQSHVRLSIAGCPFQSPQAHRPTNHSAWTGENGQRGCNSALAVLSAPTLCPLRLAICSKRPSPHQKLVARLCALLSSSGRRFKQAVRLGKHPRIRASTFNQLSATAQSRTPLPPACCHPAASVLSGFSFTSTMAVTIFIMRLSRLLGLSLLRQSLGLFLEFHVTKTATTSVDMISDFYLPSPP